MARPSIILHHYLRSPFSEKIRVAFGLKRLDWCSVLQPRIAPKPFLVALTGGYRRIPVMQIGAEVFCDTRCILDELERRHPTPSLYPPGCAGLADMIAAFADRSLFAEALGLLFGLHGDRFPPELHADRARFTANLFDGWDSAKMAAKLPSIQCHFNHHLAWLEALLDDSRPFLLGPQASLADLGTYHPLWYARENLESSVFDPSRYPHLAAWMGRMHGIGHGGEFALDPREALTVARDAAASVSPPGAARLVSVVPDDWGFDPVEGELIALSADRITLRRHDPAIGAILVHFPHLGFLVRESHARAARL